MSDDTELDTDLEDEAPAEDAGQADDLAGEAGAEDDPVAAMMAEDGPDDAAPTAAKSVLDNELDLPPQGKLRQSAFMGVPIDVTVSIGRARPLVSELVKLRRDSVLTLDSKIEDPVELFIGDRLIARGELQEMDDETGLLGVRLTEVADLSGGV